MSAVRPCKLSLSPSPHHPPSSTSYSSLGTRKEKISKKDLSSESMWRFDKMGADNVKRLPETKLPCKARL